MSIPTAKRTNDLMEVSSDGQPPSKRIQLSDNEVPCSSKQINIPISVPNPPSICDRLRLMASGNSDDPPPDPPEQNDPSEEPTSDDQDKQNSYYHKVYSKYDFDDYQVPVQNLPVYRDKDMIVEAVNNNRVVILIGFTGCGKSTQVPQFIMDSCRIKDEWCNIVVTQPRKIAAVSVAKRVCFERNWDMATVVGYKVGRDHKTTASNTLITYVTTGVLLQQLVSEKTLRRYSHIIIDEVHERDLETDYLLLVVKKIMLEASGTTEHNTKVVLMSATIDEKKFANYFTFECRNEDHVIPRVYHVTPTISYGTVVEYLDDILKSNKKLLKIIDKGFSKENPSITRELYDAAVKIIKDIDPIVMSESPDPRLRKPCLKKTKRGAVLVFLPGRDEIRTMQKLLQAAEKDFNKQNGSFKWLVLPLHSTVTSEEQQQVFKKPPEGFRKIILATNIAESSITVEDVTFVIDFCLMRSLFVDKSTNLTTLKLVWAAESHCVQRRGRAGRVSVGQVIRMVTKRCYDEYIDPDIEPEMKRCSLENIVLWCKLFSHESPSQILSYALDCPETEAIKRAVSFLKKVGGLTIKRTDTGTGIMNAVYDENDGDLTFLGKVMASLPLPLHYSKLITLGRCLGVIEQTIIIAAALLVKNPFYDFDNQLDSFTRTCKFAGSSYSDVIALLKLYQSWYCTFETARQQNDQAEKKWARDLKVSLGSLREIRDTVKEINDRLNKLQVFNEYHLSGVTADPTELSREQGLFIKVAVAGAFYPNYFLRKKPSNPRHYEDQVWRETSNNDPFCTVVFNGFPTQNEGRLYAKRIADYLSYEDYTPLITFHNTKVLATFDKSFLEAGSSTSGTIFHAIKMRHMPNNRLRFPVHSSRNDDKQALDNWERMVRERAGNICPPPTSLPPITVPSVGIFVSNIISPLNFWVTLKKNEQMLQEISQTIKDFNDYVFLSESKLVPNGLCLAMRSNEYFRGKILRIRNTESTTTKEALIFFIDTGHQMWIRSSVLLDFSPEMIKKRIHEKPCLAIKCRLQNIKPNDALGVQWSHEAISFMQRFCKRRESGIPNLYFKIYCIYDSVMIGDIYAESFNPPDVSSLHFFLTHPHHEGEHAFAKISCERYHFQQSHGQRKNANTMNPAEIRTANEWERGSISDFDFPDPPENAQAYCTLRGPSSPLEMRFDGLASCVKTKTIRIEGGSVNSVALDHDPAASTSKMLVAAKIRLLDNDNTVSVSETTIMPSIPGFVSLSSLLFAPKAELRVDEKLSKYTGVLSGCGTAYLENNVVVVNSDDDMETTFEVKIDDQDIDVINVIRHQLSTILSTSGNTTEIQKSLRRSCIKLLKREREPDDDEFAPERERAWNLIAPENFQPMEPSSNHFRRTDILAPIRRIKLVELEEEDLTWDLPY